MNFNLNKDQELVRETVSKISQKELVLKAAEVDTTGSFFWKGIKKLKEADILEIVVPSEYEGIGMDTFVFCFGY